MACSSGSLVEQVSTNGGVTWTTSALYVRSGGGCGGSSILKRVTASATEWLHEKSLENEED